MIALTGKERGRFPLLVSDLLTTITHGNGLVTNAGYDLDYRLTSLQVLNGTSVVQSKTYACADGMNLTSGHRYGCGQTVKLVDKLSNGDHPGNNSAAQAVAAASQN